MATYKDRLYAALPAWAQSGVVTAYGTWWYWFRFGPGYAAAVAEFSARDRFSTEQWHAWQKNRLTEVLRAACRVPFYSDSWTAAEKHAAQAGDLAALPLLEKEPLRRDPRAFLHPDVKPWRPQPFLTSGSTGTPIATYWTAAEYRRVMALREVRSARWAGVSFRQPRATFSGRLVVPDPASPGPYHRYNAVERQVYFSAFHLSAATAPQYAAALRAHGTRWLTGYAMSYYLLARHVLDQKLALPPLGAVITTSEKLTPEMRAVIEPAFGCRAYEEYSSVENVFFANECEQGRLHVSPDAGLVEILRPDGSPCAPGETGEVVATGLQHDLQHFVRFRIGDLAAWDDAPCPCGRAMPVLREVVGRTEDAVTAPDGRQMVRFHGVFVDQPHVVQGQIIQLAPDRILVKVVAAAGFSSDDETNIRDRVRQRLGSRVEVTVQPVESIPRTTGGKYRAVVSYVQPAAPGEHP